MGKGGERRHNGGAKQANKHINSTTHNRRGVTPLPFWVRLRAHANGSGDGAQVQGKTAKRRQHQGGHAGQGDDFRDRYAGLGGSAGRVAKAGGLYGSHTGQVLRGHGHHKQGQGQAHSRRQREHRRHKHRHSQCELKCRPPETLSHSHKANRQHEGQRHDKTRRDAPTQQVSSEHQQHQRQVSLRRHKSLHAKACQHTGEQT